MKIADCWKFHPRDLLTMNLALRGGIEYRRVAGSVRLSIPGEREPFFIRQWQHQLMSGMNGRKAFVDVVRDVDAQFRHHFRAEEIWKFLEWLIEHGLVKEPAPELNPGGDNRATDSDRRALLSRLALPLQAAAVLLIGGFVMLFSYVATPYVHALFQSGPVPLSEPDIQNAEQILEGIRVPALAEPEPIILAGRAEPMRDLPKTPAKDADAVAESESALTVGREEDPREELIGRLVSLRRELAECRIRRDECYLQNDEAGYRREVSRISELAREIGRISSSVEDEIRPMIP